MEYLIVSFKTKVFLNELWNNSIGSVWNLNKSNYNTYCGWFFFVCSNYCFRIWGFKKIYFLLSNFIFGSLSTYRIAFS